VKNTCYRLEKGDLHITHRPMHELKNMD